MSYCFQHLLHQIALPVANFKYIFDRCAFGEHISSSLTETGQFSDSDGQKLARIKMNTFNTRN
jgi:hypothetical protein